jgi:hypothetical protein
MEIDKLPRTYDDLKDLLTQNKEVSCVIARKQKRSFYSCIMRLHKYEKMRGNYRSNIGKILTILYGLYVGLIQIAITLKKNELDMAISIYQLGYRYIEKINGENIDDERVRVIYVTYS